MAAPTLTDTTREKPVSLPPRRSLRGRLSVGHVVMIVAGLLGALLTLAVLRRADDTTPVAVAAREIPAGAEVTSGDFDLTEVKVDDDVASTLIDGDGIEAFFLFLLPILEILDFEEYGGFR